MAQLGGGFKEAHVCPHEEASMHVLNAGPDCPCEPLCVIVLDGLRVFMHNSHALGLRVVSHERMPKWWTAK